MNEISWYHSSLLWTSIKFVGMLFLFVIPATYYSYLEYHNNSKSPQRSGIKGVFQSTKLVLRTVFKFNLSFTWDNALIVFSFFAIASISSMLLWVTIPLGPIFKNGVRIYGEGDFALQLTNLNSGLIFIVAIASILSLRLLLEVILRKNDTVIIDFMMSFIYKITLVLGLLSITFMIGHFDMMHIVEKQASEGWFVATLPGFISFWICFFSIFAETYRIPFNLKDNNNQNFQCMFLIEYMNLFSFAFILSIVYFGGWSIPVSFQISLETYWWAPIFGSIFLILKALFFLFLFVWMRWSFPRFDSLALTRLGWFLIFPLSVGQLLLSASYFVLS